MRRRRFIQTTGGMGIAGLAGCLADSENDALSGDSPEAVVEEYAQQRSQAREALFHSEFQTEIETADMTTTVTDSDPSPSDLAETTVHTTGELEEMVSQQEAAIVELETELGADKRRTERWGTATDDGEWRLLGGGVIGVTDTEPTGTEPSEEIANAVNVISTVGTVRNGQIEEIRIGLQPAAGASDIDLSTLTVQFVSEGDPVNLVAAQETDETPAGADAIADSGAEFGLSVITAQTASNNVMEADSDRYELVIRTDGSGIAPLAEGTSAEVTLTTAAGGQTVAFLQVPDSLSNAADGDAINL